MKKYLLLLGIFLFFCGAIYPAQKFVVVIDAGHGGKDPGAVRDKIKEKNINLGIALVLGEMIEKNMKDVKVVYTRKTDTFVSLQDRAKIANQAKANLFISVHTNSTAAKTTTLSGTDTYILGLARSAENLEVAKRENSVILLEDDYTTRYEGFDPNSPESYIIFEFMTNKYMEQSLEFASFIQKSVKSVAKRTDRGVRQAGFLVLRESSMPSVLIEVGFINNSTEATFLDSKAGQKNIANALYTGFKGYKENFDKKQGGGETSPNKKTVKQGKSEYRVQFLYSPTQLPAGSSLFKGLDPVYFYEDNGYKYTYGSSTDMKEIVKVQSYVRTLFPDAFIVEFISEETIVDNTNKNIKGAGTDKKQKGKSNNSGVLQGKQSEPTKNQFAQKGIGNSVEYRIQFLYSQEKLPDNSSQFKGLSPVDYYQDNGYKYTYGSSTDMNEIMKLQSYVRTLFPDAFVIEFISEDTIVDNTASKDVRGNNTDKKQKGNTTTLSIQQGKQVEQSLNEIGIKGIGDEIEYRIQFLYSQEKLPDNSPKFKGLSPVGYYKDNGYKYTYGSTTDQNEILRLLKQVNSKFKDAFVVKFKNGKRIK